MSQKEKTGFTVITALLVLTVIEFIIAVYTEGPLQLIALFIAGLIKAILIIQYFMHFKQLWKSIKDLWWGIILTIEEEEK
jgi:caa(3)-type oxidase subunit IV|tara:strand:- start:465 stop:704 length:240 start_codon:yes stop_codon:yes gene_type:complete